MVAQIVNDDDDGATMKTYKNHKIETNVGTKIHLKYFVSYSLLLNTCKYIVNSFSFRIVFNRATQWTKKKKEIYYYTTEEKWPDFIEKLLYSMF